MTVFEVATGVARQHQGLLRLHNLSVAYGRGARAALTVESVSLDLDRGQTLALVGQSGSGKTTIANAILRLLPRHQTKLAGSIVFDGQDISALSDREFRLLRGRRIAYVPQDPANALNPVRSIGAQLAESLRIATGRKPQRDAIIEVLDRVGIPRAERVVGLHPHELSGGMLQRVLIGQAIAGEPDLLVADEPTSALDVTVQKHILDLLDSLRSQLGLGLLLITHDLSLATERASHVAVLNAGRLEEQGTAAAVLRSPITAYKQRLIADVPGLSPGKYERQRRARASRDSPEAIAVERLSKTFGHGDAATLAVDGVSFAVRKGTTHALVGESGSGKSTTARIIVRLERQTSGRVLIDGEEILSDDHRSLVRLRRNLQLVYQNPFTSLDPRYTVRRLIAEPLARYGMGTPRSRAERAEELAASVGLDVQRLDVSPTRLSGGQRQRVAIARAVALAPQVLVLDEPTSALDVTVQAQILDLLVDLQDRLGLTYLFVSHDLAVVRQFADTVTVLQAGRVVETGSVHEVFERPSDPYTEELVRSIPSHRVSPREAVGAA